jgi:hypothetical protein
MQVCYACPTCTVCGGVGALVPPAITTSEVIKPWLTQEPHVFVNVLFVSWWLLLLGQAVR